MEKNKFLKTSHMCSKNGGRLLDEAQVLEFERPPATKHFLSMIAQEEFAKAFLLHLVGITVVPWNSNILRAAKDHKCKQLLSIVIDFLSPDIDSFRERFNGPDPFNFPPKVSDAINILRHEKIGRWESKNWVWADDPEWDSKAMKVGEGRLDLIKQDSLYVKIGKDGSSNYTPENMTENKANEEYDRGRRFELFLNTLFSENENSNPDYQKIAETFKLLFTQEK